MMLLLPKLKLTLQETFQDLESSSSSSSSSSQIGWGLQAKHMFHMEHAISLLISHMSHMEQCHFFVDLIIILA
jgi:hypothetical protein